MYTVLAHMACLVMFQLVQNCFAATDHPDPRPPSLNLPSQENMAELTTALWPISTCRGGKGGKNGRGVRSSTCPATINGKETPTTSNIVQVSPVSLLLPWPIGGWWWVVISLKKNGDMNGYEPCLVIKKHCACWPALNIFVNFSRQ